MACHTVKPHPYRIHTTNNICINTVAEVNHGSLYWRHPFQSICTPKSLIEFTIMEIEIVKQRHFKSGQGVVSNKVRWIVSTWLVNGQPCIYV